ncbi:helix-turn-helix domain-containing protein [Yoonia sp. F2084L]|uniref:helix-turn-helix transcriptional regulator n=1 Tax=Yoonia sp. F2084L TaxID=2926419 RepID=UPI001FF0F60F|nr:helix-turn-helix domain-containing protein [Yoonia sp. F2084L]MCK0097498.1 helix-turn-helix domain-containing protein [Yoonia sp. F2084L]
MAESKKLDLLTTGQVAEYTHMSTSFFEKRRSYKKSPAYVKIGARVFYRRTDIDQWLLEQEFQPQGGANV